MGHRPDVHGQRRLQLEALTQLPMGTTPERMTGGEAVVAALEALGVQHVFGIVSIHNLPIVDAIDRSSTVRMVPVRHEQAAVHCADGYARASGRLGVALTSTGPGAANAMGALHEAHHASSRVLMITGQSERRWLGKGRSTIHEADRQLDMLRTVTRQVRVGRASLRGVRDSGRRRPRRPERTPPAGCGRDPDRRAVGDRAGSTPSRCREPVLPRPDARSIGRAADVLAAAARPLIWAGGGVVSSGAARTLVQLAEQLGAPVLTSVEGRGSIPEDHPLALGANGDLATFDPVIADADVVLAVGTRFQLGSNLQMGMSIPGTLIHLDVDPGSIDRFHPVDIGIRADAAAGAAGVARRPRGPRRGSVDQAYVATRHRGAPPGRCRRRRGDGRRHAARDGDDP